VPLSSAAPGGHDGRGDHLTYSIVAHDPGTGELGIAVQSGIFAVGGIVPWVRPGVGAVATQGMAESAYGPRCLDALASGAPAADALQRAVQADTAAFLRQVGVVGADGTSAAVTGEFCIDHCGHVVGDGFAVQANMMARPAVWPAMVEAFGGATGPLSRRLLVALQAAEHAGGDARGPMSGALVVTGPADQGRLVDIRVDRSLDPVGDLGRLLDASDAYQRFNLAVGKLFGGDPDAALADIELGLAAAPEDQNLRFLRCGARLAQGRLTMARDELRSMLADRPSWEVIVRSFAAKGLLTVPAGTSIESLID
jgi:uncharacterized Ntn-hydrolase superfamily protein